MSEQTEALARLKAAPWLRAARLHKLFVALEADRGITRVVGGAVRDTLIGRAGETGEIDLATVLTPAEVTARAEAQGFAAIPTGIDFGTLTLIIDDQPFEVTTLRHDVETDGRHAVVRFGTDWTEDAKRRDFTLNALYCGPDGELFDPLGGLEDCLATRVRFIGDAATRIEEDRLRVFRFFRFSASHGGERFDPAGLAAATAAAQSLGRLSAERVGHEMTRILALPKCAKTLAVMADAGILDFDTATIGRLGVYEQIVEEPGLVGRLALLVARDGIDFLKARWRLSKAVCRQVSEIDRAARLIADNRLAEAAYRFADCLDVASDIAAVLAGWTPEQRNAERKKLASYAPPPFPVSGALLLRHGLAPGPELGAELLRLEAAWIDSKFTLTRDDLLALVGGSKD